MKRTPSEHIPSSVATEQVTEISTQPAQLQRYFGATLLAASLILATACDEDSAARYQMINVNEGDQIDEGKPNCSPIKYCPQVVINGEEEEDYFLYDVDNLFIRFDSEQTPFERCRPRLGDVLPECEGATWGDPLPTYPSGSHIHPRLNGTATSGIEYHLSTNEPHKPEFSPRFSLIPDCQDLPEEENPCSDGVCTYDTDYNPSLPCDPIPYKYSPDFKIIDDLPTCAEGEIPVTTELGDSYSYLSWSEEECETYAESVANSFLPIRGYDRLNRFELPSALCLPNPQDQEDTQGDEMLAINLVFTCDPRVPCDPNEEPQSTELEYSIYVPETDSEITLTYYGVHCDNWLDPQN